MGIAHRSSGSGVLQLLPQHCFIVKESKCAFGLEELVYLGHIISTHRVRPDPNKIAVVVDWLVPTTVKQVRAFLGLTRYYHKFVAQYAQITTPLTNLLLKDGFILLEEAKVAFDQLKTALTAASVLLFPNFDFPFVVELTPARWESKPYYFTGTSDGILHQEAFNPPSENVHIFKRTLGLNQSCTEMVALPLG